MRATFLVSAALAVVATATPAVAHPNYHYEGGCFAESIDDGSNGPQTTHTGTVVLAVVATDFAGLPAPVPVSAECVIFHNGELHGSVATASGVTAAGTASDWTYQADPSDAIDICLFVTVNGEEHTDCRPSSDTPLVPQPVEDLLELLCVADQIPTGLGYVCDTGPGEAPIDERDIEVAGVRGPIQCRVTGSFTWQKKTLRFTNFRGSFAFDCNGSIALCAVNAVVVGIPNAAVGVNLGSGQRCVVSTSTVYTGLRPSPYVYAFTWVSTSATPGAAPPGAAWIR